MSFEELFPYYLVFVKVLFVVVSVIFLVSGVDDLFIDLYYIIRSVYRKLFVMPKHRALTVEQLLGTAEQPIAIMIPAWDESAVIRRMLENTVQSVNYSNYHIFVGTYPNDTATHREVEVARERFGNIRRIVCPKDGPTNKADCLNWIYQGILLYEQETGVKFAMFVMQDSEDIVHPLSLKLFNYLVPRMDMVQLPVFPLEPPWWDFTSGHYLDEFAENHSKDLLVRERLAKTIPSAGVGCAFSRRALEVVARNKQNQLFSIDSLTEDYDFGFRLKEANLKQIFVRQVLRRTTLKRSRLTGRQHETRVRDVVAVREFFPNRFWLAVRQKARWVVGIALQGWAGIGWRGDFWARYMLYRDRKSLVTNLANILGYVVAITVVGIHLHAWLQPDGYRYPPLVQSGTWLWDLVLIDTGLLIVRSLQRFFHVRRVYGWLQAFLAVPRQLWGNVINFAATCRALYLFGRYLTTGRLIAWDKTAHAFPSLEQMQSFRRRLGDLLLEKRLVTIQQLEDALKRQEEENLPLGSLLVRDGIVKEDDLVQVLGLQMRLERRAIDPYETPLDLLARLPRRLAVRFSVYPVELRSGGQLVVAARVPLTQVQLSELQAALGRPVELCLATQSDIAFAIRRGYGRLVRSKRFVEGGGAKICDLLVSEGVLTREQADEALSVQRSRFARIGDILIEQGALTPEMLERAVSTYTWSMGVQLGDFLVARGFVSQAQLDKALEAQPSRSQQIGTILIEKGLISEENLAAILNKYANDAPPRPVRRARAAALGVLLLLAFPVAQTRAQAPDSRLAQVPQEDAVTGYVQRLVVERSENWIQREVRQFRTYPHLDRAYRLMAENRLSEACVELGKYLAIDPNDLRVWTTLMIVRHKMADPAGVVEAADFILRKQPTFVPALLYRGLAEQSRNAVGRAVESFAAAASAPAITPSDRVFALNMLADLWLRQRAYAEAVTVLEVLAEIEHDASVYLRQGMALEGVQRLPDALAAYRRAIEAKPVKPAERGLALGRLADVAVRLEFYNDALGPAREVAAFDRSFVAWYRLGTVLEKTGRLVDAAEAYRSAAGAAPDLDSRVRAYRACGEVAKKRRSWREAYDAVQAALKLRPDDPDLMAELGRVCWDWRRYPEALQWTRKALAVRPSRPDQELLATLLFALKDYAGAASEWSKLLRDQQSGEERRRILISLASACSAKGDHESASEALRQALAIRPAAATADALALSLERSGHLQEAVAACRLALEWEPSATRHQRLGTLLVRAGKPEEALEHLAEARKGVMAPKSRAAILKQQGFLFYQAGRYAEARKAFEDALALGKVDAEVEAALGETCFRMGDYQDAIAHLSQASSATDKVEFTRALAQALAAGGEPERAADAYQRALRRLPEDSVDAQEIRISLANLEAARGRNEAAATLFRDVFESGGVSYWHALVQAAESYALAGNLPAAVEANRQLFTLGGVPTGELGAAAERLGYLHARLDQPEKAAEAFRQALAAGRNQPQLHESLGYALVRCGAKHEAIEHFQTALATDRAPRRLINLAGLYSDTGRPGIAIYYLEEASRSADSLDVVEQRLLWASLGQLYAGEADYQRAFSAWDRAQSLDALPETALALARTERLLDRRREARARLEGIEASKLTPAQQAERWDELAALDRAEQAYDSAINALQKANRLEHLAERDYRIGLSQADLGRLAAAVDAFEEAVAREPGNLRYTEALGYAYRRTGRTEEAARLFEIVVRADPDYLGLYEDLGYIEMERSRNSQADRWFRQAIDNGPLRPTPTPEAEEDLRLDVFRMRGEVATLSQRLATTVYFAPTFGNRHLASVPGGTSGGVLPAQAGVELAYQAPGIGLRNGRIFQVFGRVLWSVEPNTLKFQEGSYLGGLGVRYKPFRSQNAFFSAERLFKLGDQSTSNWLLRSLYSWSCGYDVRLDKRYWNYTTFYADAAYFAQNLRRGALYGEARQGVTFELTRRLRLTPHLMADLRHENPGPDTGSYVEGGGGVSIRFTPIGGRYERSRVNFELLIHYRVGRFLKSSVNTMADLIFSGWVITTICQF